jgi:hypothetical protein
MSILCVMCIGGCSEPCEVGLQSAGVPVMWTLALSGGLVQRRNRLLISLVIGRDGSRLEFHTNSENNMQRVSKSKVDARKVALDQFGIKAQY